MKEKFLKLVEKVMQPHNLIRICLIVVPIILVFLFGWKAPINVEKAKDKQMVEDMIRIDYPHSTLEGIIVNDVLYLDWMDSLRVLYPEMRGEFFEKTKTVFYNRIDSVDTVSCAIVFKTKNIFLREVVDTPLYHIENVKRYF